MADLHVRSDSVDVEQIMRQIRTRIREKRGVDYTEQQIRELAAVKLEKFLDPRGVRSDLLEQFKPVMKKIYAKHDWQEYGGAPLLGGGGYCLICHGRSDSRAIKNAIRVGKQLVNSGVNKKIAETVAATIPVGEE